MEKNSVNFKNFLGFDISKQTLDLCLINEDGKTQLIEKIPNTFVGIKTLLNKLKNIKNELLICCEHTGVYGHLLHSLCNENGFSFWMVSALEIKRSMGITRGKSDQIDAKRIANFALEQRKKYVSTSMPIDDLLELKLLNNQRQKLIESIKSFKHTEESYNYYPKNVLKRLKIQNQKTVDWLNKQLKIIEKEIESIIARNEKISNQKKLVESIPGIGPQTSLALILATNCFQNFKNSRKIACYAGVAPFEYSSGTSIRGKTKVHYLADKNLKSLLHLCVLNTIRYSPEIKEYYTRKKEEGKHSMLIINNIKNKLLHRIFAVINRNSPYVNLYRYTS